MDQPLDQLLRQGAELDKQGSDDPTKAAWIRTSHCKHRHIVRTALYRRGLILGSTQFGSGRGLNPNRPDAGHPVLPCLCVMLRNDLQLSFLHSLMVRDSGSMIMIIDDKSRLLTMDT